MQTAIYLGGTLLGIATLIHFVPGGWTHIHQVAAAGDKFRVFDFSLSIWKPYTFWAGVIFGAVFVTASHGTDQLIVQRLLAARNLRQSKAALLSSGVAILFQFALFLLVGVMLFAYYMVPSANFGKADRIYPTFIVTHMPHGISGLLIAAILAAAMSNLSAALNSLSSSTVMDLYLRLRAPAKAFDRRDRTGPAVNAEDSQIDEQQRMKISRLSTVLWAIVLFILAVLCLHRVTRVVEVGLQIASISYGALLGVFLLGVLTRRANQTGAIIGMLCGFTTEVYVWRFTQVPFTWYVAIGTAVTFGVGYIASGLLSSSEKIKSL